MKRNSRFFVLGVAAFALMMVLVLLGCNPGIDPGPFDPIEGGQAATPTANPQAGAVADGTAITLSTTTSGATIYYTIDDSTPSDSSTEYSNTNKPVITNATTIKAIAVKSGMTDSVVMTAAYTIDASLVATPTANPPAGAVTSGTEITLSTATSGATIYYTTNGNTPNASSTAYSDTDKPTITKATTIKAIAMKDGMTDSDVLTLNYTISDNSEDIEHTEFPAELRFVWENTDNDSRLAFTSDSIEWGRSYPFKAGFGNEFTVTYRLGSNGYYYTHSVTFTAVVNGNTLTITNSDTPTEILNGTFTKVVYPRTITTGVEWERALDLIDLDLEGGTSLAYKVYTLNISGTVEVAAGQSAFGSFHRYNNTLELKGNGTLKFTGAESGLGVNQYSDGFNKVIIDGPTLEGTAAHVVPLVIVYSNGELELKSGKITGNSNTATEYGGGVCVSGDGVFTMSGGEISGNSTTDGGGGGVCVEGTFNMSGGTIRGNTAPEIAYSACGGGVQVRGGRFNMSGGTISGNQAWGGGGVHDSGVFIMTGGIISGNTAYGFGGGVYISSGAEFYMVNGTIYGSGETGNDANGTPLKNTVTDGTGAALRPANGSTITAQYGTFSGETWNKTGDLITSNYTDDTITVVNGMKQ